MGSGHLEEPILHIRQRPPFVRNERAASISPSNGAFDRVGLTAGQGHGLADRNERQKADRSGTSRYQLDVHKRMFALGKTYLLRAINTVCAGGRYVPSTQ